MSIRIQGLNGILRNLYRTDDLVTRKEYFTTLLQVEPKLDDREIFVTHLPPKAGTEEPSVIASGTL